ncbi:hypothetical protein PHLCEN_2v1540 [Hermanssonia centrifuga]|uniref:Uncharacterized protein n=1 Tax=Hermanssonia centrifuga TaxID=98765 RepID=A0A2R6RZQ6_9APHY|nr:hypothetical protein PHLCEN_2v1540 [Hermanssonia centrifuga]
MAQELGGSSGSVRIKGVPGSSSATTDSRPTTIPRKMSVNLVDSQHTGELLVLAKESREGNYDCCRYSQNLTLELTLQSIEGQCVGEREAETLAANAAARGHMMHSLKKRPRSLARTTRRYLCTLMDNLTQEHNEEVQRGTNKIRIAKVKRHKYT